MPLITRLFGLIYFEIINSFIKQRSDWLRLLFFSIRFFCFETTSVLLYPVGNNFFICDLSANWGELEVKKSDFSSFPLNTPIGTER